ncbi:uncharacterized protein MKZ38_007127 [Zalerion maritima]|uniref:Uncharacterized protein n=1 Tax=Zalerion maritima TaxID=339359 RepID=A0AAD5RJ50_9PEZI|nr:uncharacterized protein MKZ38_007127 [Zalerion maritima]
MVENKDIYTKGSRLGEELDSKTSEIVLIQFFLVFSNGNRLVSFKDTYQRLYIPLPIIFIRLQVKSKMKHLLQLLVCYLLALGVRAQIYWSLHISCTDIRSLPPPAIDDDTRDAITRGVKMARARGIMVYDELVKDESDWVPGLLEPLQHLMGEGTEFYEKLAVAQVEFQKFNDLEEQPIPSNQWDNPPNSGQGTYRNFIVVCRPDNKIKGDGTIYDNIRRLPVERTEARWVFDVKSTEADRSKAKLDDVMFETCVDEPPVGSAGQAPSVVQERAAIPEGIFGNPSYIKKVLDEKDFTLNTESRIKGARNKEGKLKTAVEHAKAATTFKKYNTPMDVLVKGLDAVLHHEMFHLTYFGHRTDGKDPYGWANNIKSRKTENPDWFALVALVVDLAVNHGLAVQKNGDFQTI